MVGTSNRAPEQLANSLLHQANPQARFAERIREACDPLPLGATEPAAAADAAPAAAAAAAAPATAHVPPPRVDYRVLQAANAPAASSSWLSGERRGDILSRFEALTKGRAARTWVALGGNRRLELTASAEDGAALLSFDELCGARLGAADYSALAASFHTVFVADVPRMASARRDEARRFITLVDQLYNVKARLVASCEVPINQLFEDEGARRPLLADEHGRYNDDYTAADEHFALRRTVSRLAEMQGMQYYLSSGASHTRHPAEGHPGRW